MKSEKYLIPIDRNFEGCDMAINGTKSTFLGSARGLCAALLCVVLWVSPAVAIGATKPTKEATRPYCPPGQSLVDGSAPEFAGIRKTAMEFAKLDFDGVRGSPNEGKYHSLIPASALRKNKSVFPTHLDSAAIRGYRWSHACLGEHGASAWIRIDVAYLEVSTPIRVWPDAARTSQRYYDAESGAMVDAFEGGVSLYRYPRESRDETSYSDYIASPRRYYLLPLQLVTIENRWLVNDSQRLRRHSRIDTPAERRRIKAMMEKRYAVNPSMYSRWNEHDEAILKMIVGLTRPAFKN